ncbi:N-lysine methyltransferase setd6-like [Glandiceps talaboti]
MNNPAKRLKKFDDSCDKKLQTFLQWCQENEFHVNEKVKVGRQDSCSEYGMIAVEDLDEGECLFEIQRHLLLYSDTCKVADILKKGKSDLQSDSGWVPLLLALMYEYTNPQSLWRPYLDLCPDFTVVDQPMFWTREEVLQELASTGIPEAVERDLKNITCEYNTIVVPFMKKFPETWSLEVHTLELYKQMVAFIMAYSFTESSGEDSETAMPVMVPMADILNHVSANNAHLNFDENTLTMVTTRPITKGEEVFNTYGQLPNWQLLHMYGFAEPHQQNLYDTVEINITTLLESAKSLCNEDSGEVSLLQRKWNWLQQLDVLDEDDKIVIDNKGVSGFQLPLILKVLSFDKKDFKVFKKNWQEDSDDDDYEDDNTLTEDDICVMLESRRQLLKLCLQKQLESYNFSYTENQDMMESDKLTCLSRRQKFALHVRLGQQTLLMNIIGYCKSATDR